MTERTPLVAEDANRPTARLDARLLLDLTTTGNCHPSFWNGLLVIGWERGRRTGHGRDFLRRGRQPRLLESIYHLQGVNLKAEDGRIVPAPPGE